MEITIEAYDGADPELDNCGYYLLSNGIMIFFSDKHKIKTDKEAKELVYLIINSQKMRNLLEKVLYNSDVPNELYDEVKEFLNK
jgi:Flp pilus assembly CpaE family ATPase